MKAGAFPAEGGVDVHMTTLWNADSDCRNRGVPVDLREDPSAVTANHGLTTTFAKSQHRKSWHAPEKIVFLKHTPWPDLRLRIGRQSR